MNKFIVFQGNQISIGEILLNIHPLINVLYFIRSWFMNILRVELGISVVKIQKLIVFEVRFKFIYVGLNCEIDATRLADITRVYS